MTAGVNAPAAGRERNQGLDLLRMVSMLMVAVLHVLGQGGVMVRFGNNGLTYFSCYFLETACLCAVNCYGLLSGYVGIRARFNPRRLLGMILTVELYSLSIWLLIGLAHQEWLSRAVLLQIFLPIQWKTWWYYSAYVGLYLLMPFLNRGVSGLSGKEKEHLLSLSFIVFGVLTMVAKTFFMDMFSLVGGYSLIWLIILYVFGASLRELEDEQALSGFWNRILALRIRILLGIFLGSTALAWLWKLLVDTHVIIAPEDTQLQRMLLIYHSPTIFANGIALLLLFRQLKISAGWLKRMIALMAPSAFYVYILHTHPLIWEHYLKGAFSSWRTLSPLMVIPMVLAAALVIYLVCTGIDIGRKRVTIWIFKGEKQ